MVTTRSGLAHKPPTEPQLVFKKRKFLQSSALRQNGDGVHRCCICLKRLEIRYNVEWFQCPSCHDVTHQGCLLRYCINTDAPHCPYCRTEPIPITGSGEIDIDILDTRWQVSDNVLQREESSDESESSDASSDESPDASSDESSDGSVSD